MTRLDIRWPLGLVFSLIGVILVVYGALEPTGRSAAENVNVIWGAVLAVFGSVMLLLARRAAKEARRG